MTGALGPLQFIVGGLELAFTLGCAAVSSVLIVRRRLDWLTGAPRAVAIGLLALAALLAAELVPLLLGVLTRATVPIASALVLAGCSRIVPARAPAPARPVVASPAGPAANPVSWLLAAVGLLIAAAGALAYLEHAATLHVTSADALGFHFPGVIRFIQTGSLWQITQYLPGQAQGNYPQYGDLLLLAVALPWHSLAFVRYVDPVMIGLAALSTYAIARELRAPAPTAVLTTIALFMIRPTLGPALPDVLTDPLFLAGFAAGTLFLLRHWRTGARAELGLAGLCLGIALGTKWYGLTDVPALILAWAVVSLACRRGRGRVARQAGALIVATALAGGIWMLRNLILTGNPIFDLRVSLFGTTIFPAPPATLRHELGFTLAHYLGDWHVWGIYIWPALRSDFGLTTAVILGGALVAAALAAAGHVKGEDRARIALLFAGAVLCLIAYFITPYTAQGAAGMPVLVISNTRYGAPAVLLAAPLLAVAAARLGPLRLVLEVVLLLQIRAGIDQYIPASAGPLMVTRVILLALIAVIWALRRTPWARAALAAIAAAGAVAFAYHYQRVLSVEPWTPADPTINYVLAHDPSGARIAVTGTWTVQGVVPVAPLFGPRFQNTVDYLGPFVEHRLEQYTSERAFAAALRRGHFQLLEIGTGFPPAADPVEVNWAIAAGYTSVTRSARLILMRSPRAT
jgi:hypothetical protein